MNTYVVDFVDPSTAEVITETVSRYTFAEAASWAYIRRLDFGREWKIDSIRKYGVVNV